MSEEKNDKSKYAWSEGDLVSHGHEELTEEDLALLAEIKATTPPRTKLEAFDKIVNKNNGEK